MNRKNKLSQQFFAQILLISLFLQSCDTFINLPNQRKRKKLDDGQGVGRVEIVSMEAEEATELGKLDIVPMELLQEILTYIRAEEIKEVRGVNRTFYQLTTGYDEPGLVGVENRPSQYMHTDAWVLNKGIDFKKDKLSKLTPETIPSFLLYRFLGTIHNLPKIFWSYLPGTQVHTLDLNNNQIRNAGAIELAKALPGTQVHTLDLSWNLIGDAGAIVLAKALPNTQVHTLNLYWNQIGDQGASELAKALPNTQVHTLDLSGNEIGDEGAIELAKALPNTQVHTLDLGGNQLGAATQQLLIEQYPHIKWIF